jgi:hypothetical protein
MKTPSLRLALALLACLKVLVSADSRASDAVKPFISEKPYRLWDDKPAPLDLKGWEFHSYPLGNGHFGVSFFGGVNEELFQFCEKSLFVLDPAADPKRYDKVGLSSLCELRLFQDQRFEQTSGYRREVDLNSAVGSVRYSIDGVDFQRLSFASYPANCFATRLSASKPGKVSFRLKALHPYLNSCRTGRASIQDGVLILEAETKPYGLKYRVEVAVKAKGGRVHLSTAGSEGEFSVEGADAAEIFVTLGTNYRLDPQVFLNPDEKKLEGFEVPAKEIDARLSHAVEAGFDSLLSEHKADYSPLFARTQIDLGGKEPAMPTAQLLAETNPPAPAARYLEELYFQFGRYLLISS